VERHIKITGNKPVILIDYVQILAPYNERATDKQNTDKSVLELKRLSRDYSIPVIGISSFNRDNYTQPVNMAAFKESGAVEYSSDVLIALQYEGMDYQPKEKDGDRQKRIRELLEQQIAIGKSGKAQSIQVKILKNRNGSKGDTVIDFYPMFNLFSEKGKSGIAQATGGEDAGDWTRIDGTEEDIPF
jgi:replicative DNA helicase